MPPIRQPSPDPTHVHGAMQNPKATNNYLPPPISQSTPTSICSIWPQSSLDLDTDHGDMIDETIKYVTHTINQTLLTSNASNTNTNKVSNYPPWQYTWLAINPRCKPAYHTYTNKHKVNKDKQNTLTQGQHYTPSYNIWTDQTDYNGHRHIITFHHTMQQNHRIIMFVQVWQVM